MSRTKVLLLFVALVLIIATIWIVFFRPQNRALSSPSVSSNPIKEIKPSDTLIEYVDPSGFSFSYPDNLSITKNDIVDDSTYSSLTLNANGVNGSLSLEISDSKFKTIEEWLKLNEAAAVAAPKEVKLGSLKALEVKTKDRLLVGALDQGILFLIEMPLIDELFWMEVYNKILSEFTFNTPTSTTTGADNSADDVSFEGEEVVE